jgi:hypothetical protein
MFIISVRGSHCFALPGHKKNQIHYSIFPKFILILFFQLHLDLQDALLSSHFPVKIL